MAHNDFLWGKQRFSLGKIAFLSGKSRRNLLHMESADLVCGATEARRTLEHHVVLNQEMRNGRKEEGQESRQESRP